MGLLCGTAWDVTEPRLRVSSRNPSFDRWRHETDCRSGPVRPRRSRAPGALAPGRAASPAARPSARPVSPPSPQALAGHGPPPGLRRHESGPSATPGAAAAGTGHAARVFRDAHGRVPHVRCEGRVRTAAVTTRPRPLGWVKLTRCVAQGSGKSREPSKPDGALKPFFGALPPAPLPPCSSRSPLRVGWAQGAAAPHPGGLGLRF